MKDFSLLKIKHRLMIARNKRMAIDLLTLSGFIISGLLLSLFVVFILDYMTRFPTFIRISLSLISSVFFLFYIPYKNRARFLFKNTIDMAKEVENKAEKQKAGGFFSILISAVEFGTRPKIGGSEELKNSIIHEADSPQFDPRQIELHDKKMVKLSIKLLVAFIVVYLLWIIFSFSTMKVFFKRAVGMSILYPTRTRVTRIVYPEFVSQYENVVLKIDVEGMIPVKGRASVTFEGESEFDIPIVPVSGHKDKFTGMVNASSRDIAMVIYLGDYKSDKINIKVIPPPYVQTGRIKIFPPKYAQHIGNERTIEIGHVKVIENSLVEFFVVPSKKVKECSLQISRQEYVLKKKWKEFVSKKVRISVPTFYSIKLVDKYNLENKDRLSFQIDIIEDEIPFVRLKQPVQEDYFCPVSLLDWEVEAYDDYGLMEAYLDYSVTKKDSKGEDKVLKKGRISLGKLGRKTEYLRSGTIDLNTLNLRANTDLIFQAKFYDYTTKNNEDDNFTDRFGASEKVLVHIVTPKKLRKIIQMRQDLINTQLDDLTDFMEKDKEIIDRKIK